MQYNNDDVRYPILGLFYISNEFCVMSFVILSCIELDWDKDTVDKVFCAQKLWPKF